MKLDQFACPECRHYPLQPQQDRLVCHGACQMVFPIRESVPWLFPRKDLSVVVAERQVSQAETQKIYNRAYAVDGLMGTDLDLIYDRETKTRLVGFGCRPDGSLAGKRLAGARILDVGTGTGRLWQYVPAEVEGYALDLSPVGAARALARRPDLTVSASVGEHLPYPDQFFDLVVSADTIEHTFSPGQTLAEIFRVLKPGGTFSASFPTPNSLRKWGWNQLFAGRRGLKFMIQLGWVLVRRVWYFGRAAFQPIDRDLDTQTWAVLLQAAGFKVLEVIDWPEPPQVPIVYLVHAERPPS
jgi:SAM-dependent methyltransferase